MSHQQDDFVGARARELIDGLVDPYQVVSPEGLFLYVNQAWCRRLGYAEADALGLGFLDLIHPDHQDPWKSIFRAVLAGEPVEHLEMVLIAKNGAHLAVEGSVWVQDGGNEGPLVCALFRDSMHGELGEKQLGRLLYKDELTGLYNRRGFAVRSAPLMEILAENSDRLGGFLMYIEIANLDRIQRLHGDEASNESLTRCAEICRKALRVHDVVGHIGHAGFAALISLPPRYQASYVVTRLRAALTHANRHARTPYELELAIGLAPVDPSASVESAVEVAKRNAIGAHER